MQSTGIYTILDVAVTSANIVVVGAALQPAPLILRTSDGGANWTRRRPGGLAVLGDLEADFGAGGGLAAASSSASARSASSARAFAASARGDVDVGASSATSESTITRSFADLDEAAVHRERCCSPSASITRTGRVVERAEERHVAGQERDLAAAERARDDHVGLARVEHLLRRDELDFHELDQLSCSVLAFASTDSTPPTLKNACSGTSSSSPLTSASNASTVSSIGT